MPDRPFPPMDSLALEREALAGDPDAPLARDAVPIGEVLIGPGPATLLPDWYMPAPMQGTPMLRGWRRAIAWTIVVTFLLIVASGLCSTYGEVVIA